MGRQIAIIALTILAVVVAIKVAISLLAGLIKLAVIGLAIGAGVAITLIVIYKIRQFLENMSGGKTPKKWDGE